MGRNVLIVGSGAREHALAWKIAQSAHIGDIYFAPGNAGMKALGSAVPLHPTTSAAIDELAIFARQKSIDLTIVGPEVPLAAGIVDAFKARRLPIFGPTATAARIEADKAFSKQLMAEAGIPTAGFRVFAAADYASAREHLATRSLPIVIKATGFAAGKGVTICRSLQEAEQTLHAFMVAKRHGAAGETVVIEDFAAGPEMSVHALSDGKSFRLLPFSRDYKKIGEGNTGDNTGGMGAVGFIDEVAPETKTLIEQKIVGATLEHLSKTGTPFAGCLYPGLVLSEGGPIVLEYNARFGDPETQIYMRLLQSDLFDLLAACANGTLDAQTIRWDKAHAVCIVLASAGYPHAAAAAEPITGIEDAERVPGVVVFHAGVSRKDGQLMTSGGRVLSVTATGATLAEARTHALEAAGKIHFKGMQYRRDIGL